MKIIKDGKTTVYYYKDLDDLLTERELFDRLQIRLDNWIGKSASVRVHPEKGKYHVLLWNSGDKKKDTNNLKDNLEMLGIEFDGEL